jgi:hypothetical protein
MSENVFTFGWIGQLLVPVPEDDHDSVSENLDQHSLGINYEGTLIYQTTKEGDLTEDFGMNVMPTIFMHHFTAACREANQHVINNTCRQFADFWYNGSDASHNDITLEQYLKLIHP